MRQRLFARLRRLLRLGPVRSRTRAVPVRGTAMGQPVPGGGRHRRDDRPGPVTATARAVPAQTPRGGPSAGGPPGGGPSGGAPFASPVQETRASPARTPRGDATGRGGSRRAGAARAAVRSAPRSAAARAAEARAAEIRAAQARGPQARPAARDRAAQQLSEARAPWHQIINARKAALGQRDCGPLEKVLRRDWEEGSLPPPEVVRAIDRLAELPATVSERLADGLDAIYVGPGGVPDLDEMGRLRGVRLPSGRATWDACAGAYGERKIIIGTRPSSTPDVVCHEVGHALDELDGYGGTWQSDSEQFRTLYGRCQPRLVSDFHRQEGSLGRREFFADAFAAIASSQRPALVDMLGGNTRSALDVMLYFNVRYGI